MQFNSTMMDGSLFREHLIRKGLRESSIELYTDVINEFLSEYTDPESIDDYNSFLKDHVYKKRSYYYYYALRAYIRWKIQDAGLRTMLIKNLMIPRNDDPVKNTIYLTPEKRDEIINNIKQEKHKVLLKIQRQTGARIGDLLKLKRNSISFEPYQGKLAMKLNIIGKRGKKVPKFIFDKSLQDEVLNYISANYLDETYYFISFDKAFDNSSENTIIRTNYNWLWQDLKKALDITGVDRNAWATHDFRRSISRDIWQDPDIGKDLQLLQNFLGHANPSTTLRYIKNSGMSNQDVAAVLAKKEGKIE